MEFPPTNKEAQKPTLDKTVEGNAELIQEHLRKINWRYLLKLGSKIIGFLGAALFYIIFMIRLALFIFE